MSIMRTFCPGDSRDARDACTFWGGECLSALSLLMFSDHFRLRITIRPCTLQSQLTGTPDRAACACNMAETRLTGRSQRQTLQRRAWQPVLASFRAIPSPGLADMSCVISLPRLMMNGYASTLPPCRQWATRWAK